MKQLRILILVINVITFYSIKAMEPSLWLSTPICVDPDTYALVKLHFLSAPRAEKIRLDPEIYAAIKNKFPYTQAQLNELAAKAAARISPPLPALPELIIEQTPLLPPLPPLDASLETFSMSDAPETLEGQAQQYEEALVNEEPETTPKPTLVKKKKKSKKQQVKNVIVVKKPARQAQRIPISPKVSEKEIINNAFWKALLANDVAQVGNLFAGHKSKIDINQSQAQGSTTPLITAVSRNFLEMTTLLLDNGADTETTSAIRLPGRQGFVKATPLLVALRVCKLAQVRLLLERGANANFIGERIPSRNIECALCLTTRKASKSEIAFSQEGKETAVKLLLEYGATQYCGTLMYAQSNNNKRELDLRSEKDRLVLNDLAKHIKRVKCKDGTITIYEESH